MSLKHGLLGLVSTEGSMTGYDLDKLFKGSLAYFWHANTSQIYRELSAMEGLGWLISERVLQEEKPNKRVYSITDKGREELRQWILSWDQTRHIVMKSAFLMRIFFTGEAGEAGKARILEMFAESKKICADYIAELEKVKAEIAEVEAAGESPEHTKYWEITRLHGEIGLKAQIEWADKAIAILEEGANASRAQ